MERQACWWGSLFNLHGRKLSRMIGCLLVGNPNSRGGAKEILLKVFLESCRTVLGEQGKHGSAQWVQKTKVWEMKRERVCNDKAC